MTTKLEGGGGDVRPDSARTTSGGTFFAASLTLWKIFLSLYAETPEAYNFPGPSVTSTEDVYIESRWYWPGGAEC